MNQDSVIKLQRRNEMNTMFVAAVLLVIVFVGSSRSIFGFFPTFFLASLSVAMIPFMAFVSDKSYFEDKIHLIPSTVTRLSLLAVGWIYVADYFLV